MRKMLMLVHSPVLNCVVDRIVLVCSLQALQVCRSWVLHEGQGSHVGVWSAHGRSEDRRPQDEFRQAYVKGGSMDTKQLLQRKRFTVLQAGHSPSVQYNPSSQAKPRWHEVDTSGGNVPKRAFGQASSMAINFVSDPSNMHNGGLRTSPGQQGTRTGQYVPSKPEVQSPKVSSRQPSAWKPPSSGKVHSKPGVAASAQWTDFKRKGGFKKPKEHMRATSGLSRGRKVDLKGDFKKHSPSHSHVNPVHLNIHEWYERPISHRFGLHPSEASGPASVDHELQGRRPGFGQEPAPAIAHRISWLFGRHPIKRLGDEDLLEETTITEKPMTREPTKTYTFPPRLAESFRSRPPNVHKKSKWMRIRPNQLTGLLGARETL